VLPARSTRDAESAHPVRVWHQEWVRQEWVRQESVHQESVHQESVRRAWVCVTRV
jgi:hypothetical protein